MAMNENIEAALIEYCDDFNLAQWRNGRGIGGQGIVALTPYGVVSVSCSFRTSVSGKRELYNNLSGVRLTAKKGEHGGWQKRMIF